MQAPTLISLFAGAGGLDIGLERAGFHTIAANDFDRHCIATLLQNQALEHAVSEGSGRTHLEGAKILSESIVELSAKDLRPDGAGRTWRPDLLAGGPPCQPFSSAGSQRSLTDTRGRLFEEFVRIAAEMRPRAILFENVRGLVTARGSSGVPGEAVNEVRAAFEGIGYATAFRVLNAADYGAPQRRVRLFMVGAASDTALPALPLPTHARRPSDDATLKPWISLGEFLAGRPDPAADDIVRPSALLASLLAGLPDGTGLKSPGRAEPTRPGGHWGYKQGTFIANQELPARTVTGASTQDWIRSRDGELRRLTLREVASLQGFPETWEFAGPKARRFLQVGNAVPATFGEVLGLSIREALKRKPGEASRSLPFPQEMAAAIKYATRDDLRNGLVRPRSPRYAIEL